MIRGSFKNSFKCYVRIKDFDIESSHPFQCSGVRVKVDVSFERDGVDDHVRRLLEERVLCALKIGFGRHNLPTRRAIKLVQVDV